MLTRLQNINQQLIGICERLDLLGDILEGPMPAEATLPAGSKSMAPNVLEALNELENLVGRNRQCAQRLENTLLEKPVSDFQGQTASAAGRY